MEPRLASDAAETSGGWGRREGEGGGRERKGEETRPVESRASSGLGRMWTSSRRLRLSAAGE